MAKRQYTDLGDLTYQQRVVLAALEHTSGDDETRYAISMGQNSLVLTQIVDVEGRGRAISDDVKVTKNRMYGSPLVISDIERIIYKPSQCQCGECRDFS